MRPKNLPHAAHDHDSTPVRTRSKSTHVSLATTSPRPRDSLDRAHRPPPQSSREVTYIGALSIERRSNGATRFSLDRTTTSRETDGGRPVDDAPIHSAAREKAHEKGTERTNARARRDKKTTRRDATHTRHTHAHTQKNTRRRGFPARARARTSATRVSHRRRPGSPNKTSRLPERLETHTPHTTRHRERETYAHPQNGTKHTKKTKRQRGFPACSQASGGWKYTHHTHHTHHTPHTPHTTHTTHHTRHEERETYTHPQRPTHTHKDLHTPTKRHKTHKTKTKRQRGFPACSQASTNAPQAGLSSLFRWGRLIFCWCERLMEASARRVCITMMTCIGRNTLMGQFCTTRDDADAPIYFHPCVPIGCELSL